MTKDGATVLEPDPIEVTTIRPMTIVEADRFGGARGSTTCDHCAWAALLRGDDVIEVRTFLRALLHRHLVERHPDLADAPVEEGTQ
jgi:hypothetical protein